MRERGRTLIERGMTLIEIMIVIAIIGMIAALVINRYTHALGVGQLGATEAQMKQINTAVIQYKLDKGVYPGNPGWQNVSPALFGGAGNQYFDSTPIVPGTSTPYTYYQGTGDDPTDPTSPYLIGATTALNPALLSNFTKTPWFGGGLCGLTCTSIVWGLDFGFDAN